MICTDVARAKMLELMRSDTAYLGAQDESRSRLAISNISASRPGLRYNRQAYDKANGGDYQHAHRPNPDEPGEFAPTAGHQ